MCEGLNLRLCYFVINVKMEEQKKKVVIASIVSRQLLLQTMMLSTVLESYEDSEDEMENGLIMEMSMRVRGVRVKPVRIEGFAETIVPQFNSKQFKQHFRMKPTAFEDLENLFGPRLSANSKIPVRKQLLAVVWLLATPDSYRSVAQKFDFGKSTLHLCFRRVIKVLNEIAQIIIVWPTGQLLETVKEKFRLLAGLRGVIGAIDGTFIKIKAPEVDPQCYITRKKFYAVTLQAVCDRDLVFTDCFAGYAGSVGDLRIFRNSDLYKDAKANPQALFPNDEYIIGDKAYPVLPWCIPPYLDNRPNLNLQQQLVRQRFNTTLSRTRQVIERAFALLKGRFRRLKFLDMDRIDLIPFTIMACCVLHNICLREIDEDNENYIQEGGENNDDEEPEANEVDDERDQAQGEARRDYIAASLR